MVYGRGEMRKRRGKRGVAECQTWRRSSAGREENVSASVVVGIFEKFKVGAVGRILVLCCKGLCA